MSAASNVARSRRRLVLWILATGAAYLVASWAFVRGDAVPLAVRWLSAVLVAVLAIAAVRSHLAFLRAADELVRRIETEALAIGFGAGAIAALVGSAIQPWLREIDGEKYVVHAVALVLMLAWSAGSWIGTRRYVGSEAGSELT